MLYMEKIISPYKLYYYFLNKIPTNRGVFRRDFLLHYFADKARKHA